MFYLLVANVFAVFVFVFVFVFFPRLPGRKIGSCFMSLRRLSCGLIASSVSATNWSWRPSIISSTFPSFPLKDRIFWNTTRETAKANIRLVWNWFDSSREKTLAGTWGEDTHSNRVMVAYFSRPLVTNIAPSQHQLCQSDSYAVHIVQPKITLVLAVAILGWPDAHCTTCWHCC